jgi:hypothetical protein
MVKEISQTDVCFRECYSNILSPNLCSLISDDFLTILVSFIYKDWHLLIYRLSCTNCNLDMVYKCHSIVKLNIIISHIQSFIKHKIHDDVIRKRSDNAPKQVGWTTKTHWGKIKDAKITLRRNTAHWKIGR